MKTVINKPVIHDEVVALDDFAECVEKAKANGKYMLAVWRMDDETKETICDRVCWQWPTSENTAAVKLLAVQMENRQEEIPPPLPEAELDV
jgi:hypothetical protein